jgi:hypothetical protein
LLISFGLMALRVKVVVEIVLAVERLSIRSVAGMLAIVLTAVEFNPLFMYTALVPIEIPPAPETPAAVDDGTGERFGVAGFVLPIQC